MPQHVNAQSLFPRFLEVHCQETRTPFITFSKDPGEILPRCCRYAAVFIITRRSVSRCRTSVRIGCVQTSGTAKILWFVYVYHSLSTFSKHIPNKMAKTRGTPSPLPKQRPAAWLRGQAMTHDEELG